jgi:hypothetical protein
MITIEKWSGLITNASPYALPGGACVEQRNVQCLKPGQIQGRAGLTTAATVGSSLAQVISAVKCCGGTSERVLVQSGSQLILVAIT